MNIRFSNIESLLEKIKNAMHINIHKLDWIDPIGIAILKQHKVSNPEIDVITSGTSYDYINRILYDDKDAGQSYFPLEYFDSMTNNIDEIANDITYKIVNNANNLSIGEKHDLSLYLDYMISEMMDNVMSHSLSQHGGFVTAQYYPDDNNKIQVVIADNGVGLLKTLSNHFTLASEAEAIQKAMEKEVTGSDAFSAYNNVPKHAGLGLFFLFNIIRYTKGTLLIVSNDTIFRYPENTFQVLDTDFKGTIVAFEIYESNLDYEFTQLFKIIGNEEEEEGEDIF